MIPPLSADTGLFGGLGLFAFFQGADGQIQPYTSDVRFSTGCHKALIPAVFEHLGIIHEVAVLMIHFVNVGGAQFTS